MINVAFMLLVALAVCLSLATAGSLAAWLWGVEALASPRFGLAVATPVVALLLLVAQFLAVGTAVIVARHRRVTPTVVTF
ncbi:MAG TPA: hypothetical protein VJ866_21975 [Pyrinomonadaceae bacterium]|nr:hypothetical protein [Pyrinomonadaceae bacterium]